MSKLFIVVAPSGAGKTTLVEAVLKNPLVGSRLQKIITYTTRAPRDKEIHGQDYYFISEAEFEEKIEANFFIEHSFVYNKYYGSSCSDMNKADEDKENSLIAILDFSGAKEVKKRIPAAITIFIEPPSFSVLEQRILKRQASYAYSFNRIKRRDGIFTRKIIFRLYYFSGIIRGYDFSFGRDTSKRVLFC